MIAPPEWRMRKLYWLIRRLCYDDALLFTNWCIVEYLYLERGLPQYRIYQADALIGVVHVRHPSRLAIVQSGLVAHLDQQRCDPATALLLEGAALTPMNAKVRDLPVLHLPAQMPDSRRAMMRLG